MNFECGDFALFDSNWPLFFFFLFFCSCQEYGDCIQIDGFDIENGVRLVSYFENYLRLSQFCLIATITN